MLFHLPSFGHRAESEGLQNVLCTRCVFGIKGMVSIRRVSVFFLIYSYLVGSIKSTHKSSRFYISFFAQCNGALSPGLVGKEAIKQCCEIRIV